MNMSTRLIETTSIPSHLWDPKSSLICIPPELADSYRKILTARNLEHMCTRQAKQTPPIGGLTLEATNEHFAKAFDGSLARCQLAVLDPMEKLGDVSNGFIQCLAGSEVVILDAPCGAAAAVLSMLCTIAELRKLAILPRVPLNIKVVGGELSPYAIQLARDMLTELRNTLESEAIFVEEEFYEWDVTDKQSNTHLIQSMVRASSSSTKRLVIISNFSGFLEREKKRKEATPQLEELLRHAATHTGSVAVWIEPDTNNAIGSGGLFQAIRSISNAAWKEFLNLVGWVNDRPCNNCSAKFRDPIAPQQTPRVGVAVVHFNLGKRT